MPRVALIVVSMAAVASLKALNGAPASPSTQFRLGPTDVISVFVWKEPEISGTATIRPDGIITLPLIGELEASGKTPSQLEDVLRTRLKSYFTDPVVNVIVTEINSYKITVNGKVRRPDTYIVRRETTVLDALALAGGLREDADTGTVTIFRPTKRDPSVKDAINVDLKSLLHGTSGRILLHPQDTLYVN